MKGVIEPELTPDGRVTVDMGAPVFDAEQLPFDTQGLVPQADGNWQSWPLALGDTGVTAWIAPVSMGNPHAVQRVADVELAPVETQGPLVQQHPRFVRHVNAGYMQIVDRGHIHLRVYERGVGETLACGSGACAAVVAGIRWGLLDATVDVHTRGGVLTISWAGGDAPVLMTGPAVTVFRGEIDIPAQL